MSAMNSHVLGHLARRGYEAAQSHLSAKQEYMAHLQQNAQAFDNAVRDSGSAVPWEFLPVVLTGLAIVLFTVSLDYTLNTVVATLTMIESPTATAIVEDKPPAYYADEPDAPLEKEPLMPAEAEADVELTLIPNKPITARITTTLKHLRQVGGFRAKWRGLPLGILYTMTHSFLNNLLAALLGFGLAGHALMYIASSVFLARFHMAWTHSIIAQPSSVPFYKRMPEKKHCKALLLPSLVCATAEQAVFVVPMVVAAALGLFDLRSEHVVAAAANHHGCGQMLGLALRFLAVPVSAAFVAIAVALPATVTLTRIEALLLPASEEAIVPFDRQAILGDIDITARGSCKKLFVAAWRSFDRASRWTLIKLYVKTFFIQMGVLFIGLHLMVAELFVFGGERFGLLAQSAAAELQLMALKASEKAQ